MHALAYQSWAFRCAVAERPSDARHCETLQPNRLRNHRENAFKAEKPSDSETDARRATIDSEAPGACVSATIWRFNASEYCRRFVALGCCLVSTTPVVDTCSA